MRKRPGRRGHLQLEQPTHAIGSRGDAATQLHRVTQRPITTGDPLLLECRESHGPAPFQVVAGSPVDPGEANGLFVAVEEGIGDRKDGQVTPLVGAGPLAEGGFIPPGPVEAHREPAVAHHVPGGEDDLSTDQEARPHPVAGTVALAGVVNDLDRPVDGYPRGHHQPPPPTGCSPGRIRVPRRIPAPRAPVRRRR